MKNSTLPVWFLVVAIGALIWNGLGMYMFIVDYTGPEGPLSDTVTVVRARFRYAHIWSWVAYGVAFSAGLIGAIGMLLKKWWAGIAFVLSLIGIILKSVHKVFISKEFLDPWPEMVGLPGLSIAIGVVLVIFTMKATERGWLK